MRCCASPRDGGPPWACKEALFTLGDQPEAPLAPGPGSGWTRTAYDDTLSYVRAMAIRVLEETGPAAAP